MQQLGQCAGDRPGRRQRTDQQQRIGHQQAPATRGSSWWSPGTGQRHGHRRQACSATRCSSLGSVPVIDQRPAAGSTLASRCSSATRRRPRRLRAAGAPHRPAAWAPPASLQRHQVLQLGQRASDRPGRQPAARWPGAAARATGGWGPGESPSPQLSRAVQQSQAPGTAGVGQAGHPQYSGQVQQVRPHLMPVTTSSGSARHRPKAFRFAPKRCSPVRKQPPKPLGEHLEG